MSRLLISDIIIIIIIITFTASYMSQILILLNLMAAVKLEDCKLQSPSLWKFPHANNAPTGVQIFSQYRVFKNPQSVKIIVLVDTM
jgi:hypothetical protein